MLTLTRRLGVAALTAAAVLATGTFAHAQAAPPNAQNIAPPAFRVAPNLPLNQAGFSTGFNPFLNSAGTLTSQGFAGPGFGGSLFSNPYAGFGGFYGGCYGGYGGGFGGYGGCYYQDPFNGYLTGAASVINAQGQFMMQYEQSQLLREQHRQMRIDTHRKILEEWLYERNLLANMPDPRETEAKFALTRALNNPTLPEILSGDAPNAIIKNIEKLSRDGVVGPTIAVDEELLKDINVAGTPRGNIGLLKRGGKLSWPAPLQGAPFEEPRKRIDQLAPDAVKQVEFTGKVDAGTIQQLQRDAAAMQERVNARELTPTQWVEARRYLDQLHDALTALQQPDVQNYFNGKWTARGKNVAELVKNLGGLKINAATVGDEVAYRMLQQRLAAYNAALEQQVAQRQ
jgi:hypothetical protein